MRRVLCTVLLAIVACGSRGLETALAGDPPAEKNPPAGKPPAAAAKNPPGVPDAAMQKAIDEAVKKGRAALLKLQREHQPNNGAIGGLFNRAGLMFEIGATALAGLALLAAGEKRGDASVDQALAFMKAKDTERAANRTTYDTGTLLMFLVEYYRPDEKAEPKEKGKTRTGKSAKNPCYLPEDVKRWVQDLVDHLVRTRKDAGVWGYPQEVDDYSNTQYAFLGLRAARDCGAVVPREVFEQAIQTTLERQEKDGPKMKRVIRATGPGERNYVIDSGDRARGWSYHVEPFRPTGSMTTAAIAILSISNDALVRPERSPAYTPQMERDLQRSVQDGFAWLEKWWTVEKNPGPSSLAWHYYYLYGLERACVFGGSDRDLVGEHDWYLEGAALLLKQQKPDGSWETGVLGGTTYAPSPVLDTAWAILFLERATRPLAPVRAPVVTQGG